MCGILGIFSLDGRPLPPASAMARGLAALVHRGPDDGHHVRTARLHLGARRLALIDPAHGRQPVWDERRRHLFAMNGEVYDSDRLLRGLEARGHVLRSRCDTEVAAHLFEESWAGALGTIDGQYALAVHDTVTGGLLLARDRMGIVPLVYAVRDGFLVFGSEARALFATGLVHPRLDPVALDAVLSVGCIPAPATAFEGVHSLPAGHLLEVRDGKLEVREYWALAYPAAGEGERRPREDWSAALRETLDRATRRRLVADAPVGIFLSGGLDSSAVAALAARADGPPRPLYSIAFPEPGFDERAEAERVARHLGVETNLMVYGQDELARDFPAFVEHAEAPFLNAEGVALFALARRAARDVKAVLAGEGSDESLAGYTYFRWEALRGRLEGSWWGRAFLGLVRAGSDLWMGDPNPLFPPAADLAWARDRFGFVPAGMMQMIYWRRIRGLVYSEDAHARSDTGEALAGIALPGSDFDRWSPMSRSLWFSSRTFLANFLLPVRGDRALSAHSLEGRYPFLDREVVELAARIPPELKAVPGDEKVVLKEAMRGLLPPATLARRKKMFLAPFGTPFVGPGAPEYVRHLLDGTSLARSGLFDPAKVASLVGALAGWRDEAARDRGESVRFDPRVVARTVAGMALNFVLSTEVLAESVRTGALSGRVESVPALDLEASDPAAEVA